MNGGSDPTQLFRDLSQIDFFNVVLILGTAWLLTNLIERTLPKLAEMLPGRMRLYILPTIPVMRLVILLSSIMRMAQLFMSGLSGKKIKSFILQERFALTISITLVSLMWTHTVIPTE